MAELLARKYSQMEVAVAVTTQLITYIWKVDFVIGKTELEPVGFDTPVKWS